MIPAEPINPQRVFWECSKRLPENPIMTGDSGSVANWYGRDIEMRRGMMGSLANAVGIHGVRIDDPADLKTKIAEALTHPGPVLIDAVVNRMELAMPPKAKAEMAKAFTLYMLKAVMSGRGDEVVELARSNLRR